jgi:hypothetical protein
MCKLLKISGLQDLEKWRSQTIVFSGKVIKHYNGLSRNRKPYSISTLKGDTGEYSIYLFGKDYQQFVNRIREGMYLNVKAEVPTIHLGYGSYLRYISISIDDSGLY